MSIAALLDRKLILQRPTVSSDGSGGAVRTFAPLLVDVPCAIAPASATVIADYARRDMVVNHHVYTATDLDHLVPGGVRLGDRFADGAAFYVVKAVKRNANAMVSSEVMYEIDCERK